MSRATRRKALAARKPGGRLAAEPMTAPAEVRRLRDAALNGMRAPEWGDMLGLLYLWNKITARQYQAGRRWCALAEEYTAVCCSPRAPVTAQLDARGGTAPDPDSSVGVREARRERRVKTRYLGALGALKRAGDLADRLVRAVCEQGAFPAGEQESEALKKGLTELATWWADPGQRQGRNP